LWEFNMILIVTAESREITRYVCCFSVKATDENH
jgi:hypothetical protein